MKAKKNEKEITFPYEVKTGSVVVKIYKVRNKTFKETQEERESFMVSHSAQGKRTQKMFAVFEEAKAHAKSVANSMAQGELDVLELRSEQRMAYVHAVKHLEPTGVALELAAQEYAEAWRYLGGKASLVEAAREFAKRHMHDLPSKTVSEAVEEMIEKKEREPASDFYMKVLRRHLREFAKFCPGQLRAITTTQISDFLRDLAVGSAEKHTLRLADPRTKNNYRATIGAFIKFSKERGWLQRDHEGIEFVPKFREKGSDIEIFTVAELPHYLANARAEMIPFLAIGAFAGLRTAEITRLDWSEVHLTERFIEVKAAKAKTASRRIVPISDNLAAWLADHAQEAGRVMPFDNVAKQIGWLVADVNAAFKVKAKEAGKSPKTAARFAWKHNALRHSFISYRVAEVQNANQVALEAGNSPAMIFKHYRELVRPTEAKKWFGIFPDDVKDLRAAGVPELRVLPTAVAA
jgi:integrase